MHNFIVKRRNFPPFVSKTMRFFGQKQKNARRKAAAGRKHNGGHTVSKRMVSVEPDMLI